MPEPMTAYVFVGPNGLRALTDDRSGQKLPPHKGPWKPSKTVESLLISEEYPVDRGPHVNETDALAAIRSQGYYLVTGYMD
jgi:hypothetical protein